ncbi:hypothetical protein BJ878DRAFT_567460 [Calycina marina]|uniref:Ubiquitin-like domain-containing protein n=1 Tax=Calycina marina TaxID=1763456 RepID=A0A9P7Z2S9_9HELO|nr:hypothetical protein BJ878DRAFT_567460 [Calycina marina]
MASSTSVQQVPAKRRRLCQEDGVMPGTADIPNYNIDEELLKAYKLLMPNNRNGIHFLMSEEFHKEMFKQAKDIALDYTDYGIEAKYIIEDFRRFLAIKVFTADTNADKIEPNLFMDTLWRAATDNATFYNILQERLDMVLRRRDSFGGSAAALNALYKGGAVMEAIYKIHFNEKPLDPVPGPKITLRVDTVLGESIVIPITTGWSVARLKWKLIENATGIERNSMRLKFGNLTMDDNSYVGDYSIGDEAVLLLDRRW